MRGVRRWGGGGGVASWGRGEGGGGGRQRAWGWQMRWLRGAGGYGKCP
jgi:hypothetical protein